MSVRLGIALMGHGTDAERGLSLQVSMRLMGRKNLACEVLLLEEPIVARPHW